MKLHEKLFDKAGLWVYFLAGTKEGMPTRYLAGRVDRNVQGMRSAAVNGRRYGVSLRLF